MTTAPASGAPDVSSVTTPTRTLGRGVTETCALTVRPAYDAWIVTDCSGPTTGSARRVTRPSNSPAGRKSVAGALTTAGMSLARDTVTSTGVLRSKATFARTVQTRHHPRALQVVKVRDREERVAGGGVCGAPRIVKIDQLDERLPAIVPTGELLIHPAESRNAGVDDVGDPVPKLVGQVVEKTCRAAGDHVGVDVVGIL